ncbi:MAG TPA: amino acid adenylation domain-containing protein, partial [Candidatus Kapabacteria bacterium]|nr:amino acid adenylation domain-containing protein [Candidatus Kapabacteria bacterium]
DFFELGGDSLKAVTVIARIHKELNKTVSVAEFFNHPTIGSLAEYISGSESDVYHSISPVEKKEYYIQSSSQKRLYFLQQMDKNSTAYHISVSWIMNGILDRKKLQDTFIRLLKRHDSFRTSFHLIDEKPIQKVNDEIKFAIEILGHNNLEGNKSDHAYKPERINKHIVKFFNRPFDLSKSPLIRVGLLKLAEEKHIFLVDMHHIISDGISIMVLGQDFANLYAGKELPEIKLQYKDYAEWQNREKVEKKLIEQAKYWKKEFAGEIPVLELPTDYLRPAVQDFAGNKIPFGIDKNTAEGLKKLAVETDVTLYMILLSIYNVFLAKITNQDDIVVGTPIAGRRHADLERIIGVFVNTLALRNYPQGRKTFTGFLQEIKERTLNAFENQDYQYEELVEVVSVSRDVSRNPLFDTMFVLQNIGSQEIKIPGLELSLYEHENKTSQFDLSLTSVEGEEKLFFIFQYSTKLFNKETIKRFIVYFKNIVDSVILNQDRKISDFEIITEEEKKRILFAFNDTETEYAKDKTIRQLFEKQAMQIPDHAAVLCHRQGVSWSNTPNNNMITYRQLNELSNRLARLLIKKGIIPNTIVGIMMGRSIEMIVGIWGILKSGGAYLPIDPDYPQERINYMLQDSAARILISKSESFDFASNFGLRISDLNSKKRPRHKLHHSSFTIQHSNLAYVIYTSGSTGKPKGVMIEHAAVHNFIEGMMPCIDFKPGKRILALTTISFDIFGLEVLLPLCKGLEIVMADEEQQRDIRLLKQLILKSKVDMLQATPSRMQMLIENGDENSFLRNLKEIMIGGEALSIKLSSDLGQLTTANIYNMYGPTETTIWSTVKKLNGAESITIGKPIINTHIYILNKYLKLQPIGIPGEMYIGGDGAARGYLNHPELTAEKFIDLPHSSFFIHHSKLYRTGDLARWRDDGNIEFLGRIDYQVKIKGVRIELEEIEKNLKQFEEVKDAAVAAVGNGMNKYLCAYIISSIELNITELKEYLASRLPEYMIPSSFIKIEKMPLNLSGKIDRKALCNHEGQRLQSGATFVEPSSDAEKTLAALWKEVLKLEKVGIYDNFFELGGNSLKVVQLNDKLREMFKLEIPVAAMFRYLNIYSFTKYLNEIGNSASEQIKKSGHLENLKQSARTYKDTVKRFKKGEK